MSRLIGNEVESIHRVREQAVMFRKETKRPLSEYQKHINDLSLSCTDSSDDDHVVDKRRRISLSSTPFQSDCSSPYPSSSRSNSSIRSSPFSSTVAQRMSISPSSSVPSTLDLDLSEDDISRFEKRLEEGYDLPDDRYTAWLLTLRGSSGSDEHLSSGSVCGVPPTHMCSALPSSAPAMQGPVSLSGSFASPVHPASLSGSSGPPVHPASLSGSSGPPVHPASLSGS